MWQVQPQPYLPWTDLNEAQQIAERGPMRLHLADIHPLRMRNAECGMSNPEDSREELQRARTLIEHCGYWRRKQELEDAEEAAKSW